MKQLFFGIIGIFLFVFVLSSCTPSVEDFKNECMETEEFKKVFGENHEKFCDCWSQKAKELIKKGEKPEEAGIEAATNCSKEILNNE